jgi:hypothetical protein
LEYAGNTNPAIFRWRRVLVCVAAAAINDDAIAFAPEVKRPGAVAVFFADALHGDFFCGEKQGVSLHYLRWDAIVSINGSFGNFSFKTINNYFHVCIY